jgi:WD40 repeat protein
MGACGGRGPRSSLADVHHAPAPELLGQAYCPSSGGGIDLVAYLPSTSGRHRLVASGRVWDSSTGDVLHTLEGSGGGGCLATFAANGRPRIALGAGMGSRYNGDVLLWDGDTYEPVGASSSSEALRP